MCSTVHHFLLPKKRLVSVLGATVTVCDVKVVGVQPNGNTSEIVYVPGADTPKQMPPVGPVVTEDGGPGLTLKVQLGSKGSLLGELGSYRPFPLRSLNLNTQISAAPGLGVAVRVGVGVAVSLGAWRWLCALG